MGAIEGVGWLRRKGENETAGECIRLPAWRRLFPSNFWSSPSQMQFHPPSFYFTRKPGPRPTTQDHSFQFFDMASPDFLVQLGQDYQPMQVNKQKEHANESLIITTIGRGRSNLPNSSHRTHPTMPASQTQKPQRGLLNTGTAIRSPTSR